MQSLDFMPSVGQQIREQRLRVGLKLDEISARSRINLHTLQAIENDDLASFSSPFLYKSFVRQFAEHIQLELGAITASLDEALLGMPQPRMPGEGDLNRTRVAPLPMKGRHKNFRWLYSIASLAIVMVACSSLYGIWQTSKATWLAGVVGMVTHTYSRPASQEQSLASANQRTGPAAATNSPEFRVELSAIERSWLTIVEDGQQTFSGVLAPDQTKVLEGHEIASIRTRNAGGISCIFNGKPIGPLGPRGQVRTIVFTKSNYEVLDAPPTPVALIQVPAYR